MYSRYGQAGMWLLDLDLIYGAYYNDNLENLDSTPHILQIYELPTHVNLNFPNTEIARQLIVDEYL